jgi:hypothetical protein
VLQALQAGQRLEQSLAATVTAQSGPEARQLFERAGRAVLDQSGRDQDGVDRAGAGAADGAERQAALLKQAIQRAPGEGAVRAAALQRQIEARGLDPREAYAGPDPSSPSDRDQQPAQAAAQRWVM